MVIKVYITNMTSNSKVKHDQRYILDILEGKHIEFETVDITDPSMEEEKKFMRANANTPPGSTVPLPPQIFSDEEYLGDKEALFDSVENDQVDEFLKLCTKKQTSQAQITVTGGKEPSE